MHQPTPEQLDELARAHVAAAHARAHVARAEASRADAQHRYTLAVNELTAAISAVLYGPTADEHQPATPDPAHTQ